MRNWWVGTIVDGMKPKQKNNYNELLKTGNCEKIRKNVRVREDYQKTVKIVLLPRQKHYQLQYHTRCGMQGQICQKKSLSQCYVL